MRQPLGGSRRKGGQKTEVMKFKHNYNASEFPRQFSQNDEPSETVPGMGYTIAEIMQKFASGVHLPVERKVYYDGEDNFDSIDPTLDPDFDFSEAQNQLQNVTAQIDAEKAAQLLEKQRIEAENAGEAE